MNETTDKRKALGRGLDSLLPSRPVAGTPAQKSEGGRDIPVDQIDPNPYQTRRQINEESLHELTESIKVTGVVQPVVLRPGTNGRFQLVAGLETRRKDDDSSDSAGNLQCAGDGDHHH